MDNKIIENFIKTFVNDDSNESTSLLSKIINIKMQSILKEDLAVGNNVKLVGDDVLVDNKKVGTIRNDINNFDEGIVFIDSSGKETEFDSLNALYTFVISKYTGKTADTNSVDI